MGNQVMKSRQPVCAALLQFMLLALSKRIQYTNTTKTAEIPVIGTEYGTMLERQSGEMRVHYQRAARLRFWY